MNKKTTTKTDKIAKLITTVYWVLLGVFALVLLTQVGTGIVGSQAATSGPFSAFNAQVCSIIFMMSNLIGTLAAMMIVIGGITYAMSQGSDKGGFSINSAKNMILSAITGLVFFMMGSYLLASPCPTTHGGYGLLNRIFSEGWVGN